MPELPEVETVRCALLPIIEGARINSYWQSPKTLRLNNPPQRTALAKVLIGKTISAVARRGKNMLWFLANINKVESGILLIHLGMSGKIYWRDEKDLNLKPEKHEHWRVKFDNINDTLCYVDARRFGGIAYFNNYAEVENSLAHGPEPLMTILHKDLIKQAKTLEFTADFLFTKIAKSTKPIKIWIMDAHNVAGVGNIYASEALFMAQVSPTRLAKSLSKAECLKLVNCIKQVLEKAINAGGSTLRDYRKVDGEIGGFQDKFKVYARSGEKCLTCKSEIIKIVQGGRATYYCPKCQK